MEKPGEKLSLKPFKYPGREPKALTGLLGIRPEFKSLYIYDILLSSGELLYSCAGGMGVTNEKYIVDMHKFISRPTSVGIIKNTLPSPYTRRKYHSLREQFNERTLRTESWAHCSELFCLWAGSSFSHRYREHGYDGSYMPTSVDGEGLNLCSQISREKKLIFRREGLSQFSESIITDQTVVYAHLPTEFGRYGAGFLWNEKTLGSLVRILTELSGIGYKVCISAQHERRGKVFRNYNRLFPSLDHIIVPQFKVSELTFENQNSEIYLFNF
jgi:hypothetical protein